MKPTVKSDPVIPELKCTNPASFWYWSNDSPPVRHKAEWANPYLWGAASSGPSDCQIKFVCVDHARSLGFDW
jgi:hypothetical protein